MDRHDKILLRWLIVCFGLMLLGPTVKLVVALIYISQGGHP